MTTVGRGITSGRKRDDQARCWDVPGTACRAPRTCITCSEPRTAHRMPRTRTGSAHPESRTTTTIHSREPFRTPRLRALLDRAPGRHRGRADVDAGHRVADVPAHRKCLGPGAGRPGAVRALAGRRTHRGSRG